MSNSKIIIQNGIIVTLNSNMEIIENGTVVIEGNKIIAVGTNDCLEEQFDKSNYKVIDAKGHIVMPGLVDLHFHSAIGRGYGDNLPLYEYLMQLWYPMIRALTPEDAYWAALCSYSEAIRSGTTCVNDMWRQMESCGQAAIDIGMRAVLSNDVAIPEERLDTLEDNLLLYDNMHGKAEGRIEVYIGIEWLPLASKDLLKEVSKMANELKTGIHIHLNESISEVEICKEKFGRRPTELAYDCGILGKNTVAAHCVWLSDKEIALMAATDTSISHNPSSNAKLGNGIARVPEMLAKNINVGFGHDAAECNNSRDMFEVIKWASLIHKANRVDVSLMPAEDVLRMATQNSAKALKHNTGSIEVGKLADIILIDTKNEHYVPLVLGEDTNIYAHLVYSSCGADVVTSIINGEVVMENRILTKIDQYQVMEKANTAFNRILSKIR